MGPLGIQIGEILIEMLCVKDNELAETASGISAIS